MKLKPVRQMTVQELQRERREHVEGRKTVSTRRLYSLENELAKRGWH